MSEKYLMPTQEAGRDLMMRKIAGKVVMLNLLRFREVADYSGYAELAPAEPISGAMAYQLYIDHTLPYLEESGGEVVFMGKGGSNLIGPSDEQWDAVLLVRQTSVDSFIAFESNAEYMKGIGHRIAALEDSRLLPMVEELPDRVVELKDVIRKAYAAFNARDIDKALSTMQPDVQWSKAWEGGYIAGHDEIKAYWTRQWKEINPSVAPVGFTERENGRLAVMVQQKVKDLEGTVLFDGMVKHVYTFEKGLIKTMDIELV